MLLAGTAWSGDFFRDDFEGPSTSFEDAGSDANYRIEGHARSAQGPHSGRLCELLVVRGNNGTYVHVAHPATQARVISELAASIWVKADRPGLQLLVRVTLPRTADPQTGKPMTTLLRGPAYERVGAWQQLRIGGIPEALDRHVRVLRAQFGKDVDEREAYLDKIVLNVYGGPGVTNVWIDDLEVAGIVSPQAAGQATAQASPGGMTRAPQPLPPTWAGAAAVPPIERSGPILLVGGKPFFPRIIEYQGEAPARLKTMGFNAARLKRAPSEELLRDAAAAGLFLIAPPPPAEALEKNATPGQAPIDSRFDSVLAWDLGAELAAPQLDATRRWAKLVQSADQRARPIVCQADSELTAYTRPPIHVLLARRDAIGTSLPLKQYSGWLRGRAQLALTGTILWASIQTQPTPQLLEQLAIFARTPSLPAELQESQIRAMVHAALAAGARGLCFQSRTRLDANDAQTRRRSAILELVNLELSLVERWPASGNFTTTADSSDPHAAGAVIETDRSRLLLPMFAPPNSQLVMGSTSSAMLNYTVPGVPEEDNAYELSPVTFRPLSSKRVAGGTQVLLGEMERDSLVVFTSDQLVIRSLAARLAQTRSRAAELARQIASAELVASEIATQRLATVGRAVPSVRSLRLAAQNDLRQSETLVAKGDTTTAYYHARHALAMLHNIERSHFEQALSGADLPLSDPQAASFATLADHFRFTNELASAARSGNRLSEGDCEDLERMMRAGWKHYRHPLRSVATSVDLSPHAAHSGRSGLRMRVVATDEDRSPSALEAAPMWVTTAPLAVEPGQILEIRAWVRIARPIVGSVDGLMIIDTLAGESLALRVTQSEQWQQVTSYRAVPRAGAMALTFVLSGMGEAWIDDVSIQVINRGGAIPQQQAQQRGAPDPFLQGG
jgi:hypothetical protein